VPPQEISRHQAPKDSVGDLLMNSNHKPKTMSVWPSLLGL